MSKLRLVLPLLTVFFASTVRAEFPEVKAGTHAEECVVTIAEAARPCETYFYLGTPEGKVSIFILATPHGVAFTGSSTQPATDERYVFAVEFVRREEGDTAIDHEATGECVVTTLGTGQLRSIAMECIADSDLGRATLSLKDGDARLMVQ